MKINKITNGIVLSLIAFVCLTGCKKALKVDFPIDRITAEQTYSNSSTAILAMTGIYSNMVSDGYNDFVSTNLLKKLAVLSDELSPPNYSLVELWQNQNMNDTWNIWNHTYLKIIYPANAVIDGVTSSGGIPDNTKKILIGEAKFMRAFGYFYLVNLYGDVPLTVTTDFKTNMSIPRTSKYLIYAQIIKDLVDAQNDLTDNFLAADLKSSTLDRVRPNKAAATALLARVYLYLEEWNKAEIEATKVIENSSHYKLEEQLNAVFLNNSQEAIWQLQPNSADGEGSTNVPFARFVVVPDGDVPELTVSSWLLNSFEQKDQRLISWTKTTAVAWDGLEHQIPYKYKIGRSLDGVLQQQTEYIMVLRLAEQFLIRAEARVKQGKIETAKEDIFMIRKRAGLNPVQTNNVNVLLDVITHERQVELFAECGDRWLDLKRLNKLNNVMEIVSPAKVNTVTSIIPQWDSYKAFLPIPFDEFRNNPALRGHQNSGYSENY